MKHNHYVVILTNVNTEQEYNISAFNSQQAIILAQAEAIKRGCGYTLKSIKEV